MNLRYHRSFQKQFNRLPQDKKQSVKQAILLFEKEPMHPQLRNHPLKGAWVGHRSISVGGNLRLHYKTISKNEVLFLAISTHSQLYK